MKIIQLNIWQGKIGRPISNFLKKEQPDIVCMQEVNELKGHAGGLFSGLEDIVAETGFKHVSVAPVYSFHYQNRVCRSSNATVSNLPIRHEEVTFITGVYRDNFDRTEHDYNARNMQTVKIELPDQKQLIVVNHHGYHIYDDNGDNKSMEAMQKVADHVKAQDGPLILCGDFNVHPESLPMQVWKDSGLRNLVVEDGTSTTLSKLHYLDRDVVCDYVFTSKDVRVQSFRVEDPLVSDHKALILEFDL